MNNIFETLSQIGVASIENREIFSDSTRDMNNLKVYRDRKSGVIYIDEHFGGEEIYTDAEYRRSEGPSKTETRSYEATLDAERRIRDYRAYVAGRRALDFGCGDGAFLKALAHTTTYCCGVELQQDYLDALNEVGIPCVTSLDDVPDESLDTVVCFHVLEHLPQPLPVLEDMKRVLKPGGTAVFEVPHANDFLLTHLQSEAFKAFTLWSQHLVLHTRESLLRLLQFSGLGQIVIEGVQRYPLSNHLTWLSSNRPGGHKLPMAAIDTPALTEAYEAALNRIDATDTLVAIARKV